MTGQTITSVDPLLKDFYVDKVVEEIKQQQPLSDYFKKRDDMPTDGRQVFYPVHLGRNVGVGAIGAGGNLPQAGAQSWQDMKIPYRYNYARIQIDAQSLKATKTSKGAFEKVFDAEIMGAAKDCGRNRNRQMFGYGTGVLATIITGVASATQTLSYSQGLTDANGAYNPARFLAANQIVAGIAANGLSISWVGTVLSVNAALSTVTFTGSVTSVSGDQVVTCSLTSSSALADTGYNNEVMGLLGMVDDGTFLNVYNSINRTTYPSMQSSRINLGGGAISTILFQKAFDAVYQKSDGKLTDMFTHPVTLREHLSNLTTFKRYTNEFSMAPDAGFEGAAHDGEIEFNETPIHVDRDCPYGTIFGLDESMLFRYVNEEGKWADEDGTILLRVSGVDAYEGRFRLFDNFCNDAPNRCFVISNIGLSAAPESIQLI
jgi:hypothetical protein